MGSNIATYTETFFRTFDERPFGAVDSLVFSALAYTVVPDCIEGAFTWEGVRLTELLRAEHFDAMWVDSVSPGNYRRLLTAAVASPRFRGVEVCGYVQELDPVAEKQFAAMTFRLGPDLAYVAFRGTDATIVGWKEDFNMAFKCPVPSQEAAAHYVDEAARHLVGTLLVGGHSKGGNLAVYAAAKCASDVRERIGCAYSHDGPGFMESVLRDPDFVAVADKVHKTIPRSSLVGILLEDNCSFTVVQSKGLGLLQHDPFMWDVRDGEFALEESIAPSAHYTDRTLRDWIAQTSEEQRELLVDTVHGVLNANNDVTFAEWRSDLGRTLPAIVRSVARVDRESARVIAAMARQLAAMGVKNVPVMFAPGEPQRGGFA